jgi:type IV pilus assembly protein PilA
MAIVKRLTKRGFTLIELMIVVVIIGILAALAIYGVQKYVSNSKSAEARQMLGRLSKDSLTAFEGENQAYEVLSFGSTAGISRRVCASAGASIPSAAASIKAKKYQPSPDEWRNGGQNTGWACLKTSVTTPIYYMYGYGATGTINPAAAGAAFSATAQGDLDGDGILSTFTLGGAVKAGTSGDLAMVLATTVAESNPEE